MEDIENIIGQETKEVIERVRTPIDERFDLVVTTKPFPNVLHEDPNEAVSGLATKTREVVIRDSQNDKVVVSLGALVKRPVNGPEVPFVVGESFAVGGTTVNPRVQFPEEALSNPIEIFAMLHELGHIKRNDEMDSNLTLSLITARVKMKRVGAKSTAKEIQAVIQEERNAWAEAIKLARRLKREYDVDLFQLFNDTDEFMGWLRATGLRSYERFLGTEAYTKDTKVKKWERSLEALVSPEDFHKAEKVMH